MKSGPSSGRQYYSCRECNRKRCESYRSRNRGRIYEVVRRSTVKHMGKHLARLRLNHAVSTGKVEKLPCKVCGRDKAEGHHEDYSKPLDVIWLCRQCHADTHKK